MHDIQISSNGISIKSDNKEVKLAAGTNVLQVSDANGVEALASKIKLTDASKKTQFILDQNGISKKAAKITLNAIQQTTLTAARIQIG